MKKVGFILSKLGIDLDPETKRINIEFEVPESFRDQEYISVEILGNFTSWCPFEMAQSKINPYVYIYEVRLKRGYKHRFHFMVNGEDMIDPNKKTVLNKFGNESNFVAVPLLKLENKYEGDITQFMSQDINYIDSIDYPVFVSKESAMLIKKRTTREDKFLHSKIKNDLAKV